MERFTGSARTSSVLSLFLGELGRDAGIVGGFNAGRRNECELINSISDSANEVSESASSVATTAEEQSTLEIGLSSTSEELLTITA